MIRSALILMILLFSACTVLDERDTEPSQPVGSEKIDYEAIRQVLRMDRPATSLGFEERTFNTCDIGHGYPTQSSCRNRQMGLSHFRLLCRDSTGTVSEVGRMDPFAGRRIRWEVNGMTGYVTTDSGGYGQISLITKNSKDRARLIIYSGDQYFGVRLGDFKMHVLPSNWCR